MSTVFISLRDLHRPTKAMLWSIPPPLHRSSRRVARDLHLCINRGRIAARIGAHNSEVSDALYTLPESRMERVVPGKRPIADSFPLFVERKSPCEMSAQRATQFVN